MSNLLVEKDATDSLACGRSSYVRIYPTRFCTLRCGPTFFSYMTLQRMFPARPPSGSNDVLAGCSNDALVDR